MGGVVHRPYRGGPWCCALSGVLRMGTLRDAIRGEPCGPALSKWCSACVHTARCQPSSPSNAAVTSQARLTCWCTQTTRPLCPTSGERPWLPKGSVAACNQHGPFANAWPACTQAGGSAQLACGPQLCIRVRLSPPSAAPTTCTLRMLSGRPSTQGGERPPLHHQRHRRQAAVIHHQGEG